MGGSPKPQIIEAPAPPPAPTLGGTMQDYIKNYPQLVAQQKEFGPQLAALDYELFSQYAPKYTEAAFDLQNKLYPETGKLQENLATQALQGMSQGLPEELKRQYVSDFNAGLGANVNAPIGVSDRNVALIQLQEQWKNYYQNLGLSVAGRQPLQQTANPSFQNPNEGFGNAMNFAQGSYGGQMQGYNSSLANRIISPGKGGFSGSGALGGAYAGSMFGPIGAIGGGVIGGFGF